MGVGANGREAIGAVLQLSPDLMFLDIQMPELDGFGVIAALGDRVPPAVVFATAFDQFAVKAFEVHALDYLLKPFDRERVRETIRRVARRLPAVGGGEPAAGAARFDGLLQDVKSKSAPADRVVVKTDKRMVLVPVDEIEWVEAADNYVVLHTAKEHHMQRETLAAMAERLPPEKFVRISRSAIVNVGRVKELQPLFHGEYAVMLKNGTRLTLTRTYRESLARLGIG